MLNKYNYEEAYIRKAIINGSCFEYGMSWNKKNIVWTLRVLDNNFAMLALSSIAVFRCLPTVPLNSRWIWLLVKPLLYKDEMASAPNRSTSQKDYLKVVWKTSHKIIVSCFLAFYTYRQYQLSMKYAQVGWQDGAAADETLCQYFVSYLSLPCFLNCYHNKYVLV